MMYPKPLACVGASAVFRDNPAKSARIFSALGKGLFVPMRGSNHLILSVFLIFLLGMGLTVGASGQASKTRHKPKAAKKAQPETPLAEVLPETPPPPPTPEQMPAKPPTVTYQNGLLSIVAPNSTLSDILQAVKSKTAAAIDVPAGANERVMGRFGPGPAREVIAALLNGSHFNYVMIGSDKSPDSVAQIILTPRTGGADTGPVNAGSRMPAQQPPPYSGQIMQPQPLPQPAAANPPQADPEAEPQAESEEDDTAQQQDENADQGSPEQATQENQDGTQPQVKTPEQLLQELQQQQQQQQQQQGQQPLPVPPPPPQ